MDVIACLVIFAVAAAGAVALSVSAGRPPTLSESPTTEQLWALHAWGERALNYHRAATLLVVVAAVLMALVIR